MSRHSSTFRHGLDSTLGRGARQPLAQAVTRLRQQWEQAGEADLPAALESNPGLLTDRSLILDLVQVEIRRLIKAGLIGDAERYCERFGELDQGLLQSIYRCAEVELLLANAPEVLGLLAETTWPASGEAFGEFELIEELGRGAVSRVFLCRQPSLGNRHVALKVTRNALSEAATLGKMKHPNVVPVYSVGVDQGSGLHWICMPYLGRLTLDNLCRHGLDGRSPDTVDDLFSRLGQTTPRRRRGHRRFDDTILAMFAELAGGLASVHEEGVLHGDLKPSNVLLANDGVAMLIDFNLSRDIVTGASLVGGTLPYMAPEQLRAILNEGDEGACQVTPATEAYSFGVVLLQILLGRHPFAVTQERGDLRETVAAILQAQVNHHSRAAHPSLDNRIERLVDRLLSPAPENRPKCFREIERELRVLISPAMRGRRLVERRPRACGFGTVAIASVVGLSITVGAARLEGRALRRAEQLVASDQHAEASAVLTEYLEKRPDDANGNRLLGHTRIELGKPEIATENFMAAWRSSSSASDLAMVGYAANLAGRHDTAVGAYERVSRQAPPTAAVAHNYGASLLVALVEDFDDARSRAIETHLLTAYSLAPSDESIRVTMLRHYLLVSGRSGEVPPAYPRAIAELAAEQVSDDFCVLAIRFLDASDSPDSDLVRIGGAYLRRLLAVTGPQEIDDYLPDSILSKYRELGLVAEVEPLERTPPTGAPPQFLNPILGK